MKTKIEIFRELADRMSGVNPVIFRHPSASGPDPAGHFSVVYKGQVRHLPLVDGKIPPAQRILEQLNQA